jgi:hypothetical protein
MRRSELSQRANSDIMQRSEIRGYSITSSARTSSGSGFVVTALNAASAASR